MVAMAPSRWFRATMWSARARSPSVATRIAQKENGGGDQHLRRRRISRPCLLLAVTHGAGEAAGPASEAVVRVEAVRAADRVHALEPVAAVGVGVALRRAARVGHADAARAHVVRRAVGVRRAVVVAGAVDAGLARAAIAVRRALRAAVRIVD